MRRGWRSRNWRTILLSVLRMSGGNAKKKTEHGGLERAPNFHGGLAADTNSAEAEDDVAAGGGPAKAHHGAEAGEEKHLVQLMAQIGAGGSGKNLIVSHLAVGIDGDVDEKAMRKR